MKDAPVVLELVYPSRMVSDGAKMEKETKALLETFLGAADISGNYRIVIEDHILGSPGKVNSVRFQYAPLGSSGTFLLRLNWQLTTPDSAFSAYFSSKVDMKPVWEKLDIAYPRGVFYLNSVGRTKPGAALKDVLEALLLDVCAEAERYADCRITRGMIDQIARPYVHVLEEGASMADALERKGYLAIVDVRVDDNQMFEVTTQAFQSIGQSRPGDVAAPAQETPPAEEVQAPAPSPTVSNVMTDLLAVKNFLASQKEAEQLVANIETRMQALEGATKLAQEDLERATRKLHSYAQQRREFEKEMTQAKSKLDADKKAEAQRTLSEFKQLLQMLQEV